MDQIISRCLAVILALAAAALLLQDSLRLWGLKFTAAGFINTVRLPSDRLVATDIAHALPITVIAAAGHAALGHADLRALACLLVGSIPGVLLATRAAIRLPPQLTRALIAAMLIVVSERLFSA